MINNNDKEDLKEFKRQINAPQKFSYYEIVAGLIIATVFIIIVADFGNQGGLTKGASSRLFFMFVCMVIFLIAALAHLYVRLSFDRQVYGKLADIFFTLPHNDNRTVGNVNLPNPNVNTPNGSKQKGLSNLLENFPGNVINSFAKNFNVGNMPGEHDNKISNHDINRHSIKRQNIPGFTGNKPH